MATNVVTENIGEARENVTGWWNRARVFLLEVRNELKRVTWPSQKEVYAATIVVIVYLGMNAFYLHVIPMEVLKALELRVIDAAAERLFAGAAAGTLTGLSVLITAGTISAMRSPGRSRRLVASESNT